MGKNEIKTWVRALGGTVSPIDKAMDHLRPTAGIAMSEADLLNEVYDTKEAIKLLLRRLSNETHANGDDTMLGIQAGKEDR